MNITIQQKAYETLDFTTIKKQCSEFAATEVAKQEIEQLVPILNEDELKKQLRDTTQARQMLDSVGMPPIPTMEQIEEYVERSVRGELLSAEQFEQVKSFLTSVRRLKEYLIRGQQSGIGIAFYSENLNPLTEVEEELARSIRGGRVDDFASPTLRDVRKELILKEEKIKMKAEAIMKANKSFMAENFVVRRNGRVCIPIKKDYKGKIPGSVVDKSSTGATLFLEPAAIGELREEYDLLKIEEECEERRILYVLLELIAGNEAVFRENIRMIGRLDYMFAKGKLSAAMKAVEPKINTNRIISICQGRHPLIPQEASVPLEFELGKEYRGIIVTGPNTGGKTVSMKTVGLFCLMAQSGLHVPCASADLCMNSQVLCDIGDGQNISDNLSTFSSHIRNVIDILETVNDESLILLDELGSGTDPAEGMGIAIAVLEELRKSGALFFTTTHYPEVKTYAATQEGVVNASMAFDRENLKPLYRLDIGVSGESCALYIAKRLGLPERVLHAAKEVIEDQTTQKSGETKNLKIPGEQHRQDNRAASSREKHQGPHIQKKKQPQQAQLLREKKFSRGDSVMVYPERVIGIVVKPEDNQGNVLVQIKKEKKQINQKRLKLRVAATELYPEDYDFSIVFDSVAVRKARHQMGRHFVEGLEIETEE